MQYEKQLQHIYGNSECIRWSLSERKQMQEKKRKSKENEHWSLKKTGKIRDEKT